MGAGVCDVSQQQGYAVNRIVPRVNSWVTAMIKLDSPPQIKKKFSVACGANNLANHRKNSYLQDFQAKI